MFKIKFLCIILLLSTLSACVSPMQTANQQAATAQLNTAVETPVTVPFDEAQAKLALEYGNTNISGVLYHKVMSSKNQLGKDLTLSVEDPHYIANTDLYLYPVTAHLEELLRLEKENTKRNKFNSKDKQLRAFVPDSRLFTYAISTKTDEYGRYRFDRLKPGRYYIYVPQQEVTNYGTRLVADGQADISDGLGYLGTVTNYREENYNVRTYVDYSEFIDIAPEQTEINLESRMRIKF